MDSSAWGWLQSWSEEFSSRLPVTGHRGIIFFDSDSIYDYYIRKNTTLRLSQFPGGGKNQGKWKYLRFPIGHSFMVGLKFSPGSEWYWLCPNSDNNQGKSHVFRKTLGNISERAVAETIYFRQLVRFCTIHDLWPPGSQNWNQF